MKKTIISISMVFTFTYPYAAYVGAQSSRCATRYPIIISYAWTGSINHSFGRIPGELEYEGADVYIAGKHACQSTMYRARELKESILYILAATGKSKVNIIGHCHGTLDSRYMISNLGMADKVASWTSISGGQRGLILFDLFKAVTPVSFAEKYLNPSICYDDLEPDNIAAFTCLTRDFMRNVFNPNTPDQKGVYYQSWVANMKEIMSNDLIHIMPWVLVKIFEGDNDGYVSNYSGNWGNFRGPVSGSGFGLTHYDVVDNPRGVYTQEFNIVDFYIGVAEELKALGY